MIYDNLSNYKTYINIHPGFKKAFDYLLNTNFSKVKADKYILQENELFALVQEYKTKNEAMCKLEGHKNFIDIQYMFSGEEYMGHSLLSNQTPIESNADLDVSFYNAESENIRLKENEFIVFFPQDLHKPCIFHKQPSDVKKIVIKIRI